MITDGTKTDRKVAFALIKDIKTNILIADRAYDTNDIVKYAKNNGIEIVIPPRSNRKLKRNFDDSLYSCRYIIENTFLSFKCWYGITTCYFKTYIEFIYSLIIHSISMNIFIIN